MVQMRNQVPRVSYTICTQKKSQLYLVYPGGAIGNWFVYHEFSSVVDIVESKASIQTKKVKDQHLICPCELYQN